ncbi:MAG: outer membrane lipoprotein LolB [Nevskiaceae bacterium]|nr:MAG: outer membrane lipoprotein LolB [Nevskiaceae bacterium]
MTALRPAFATAMAALLLNTLLLGGCASIPRPGIPAATAPTAVATAWQAHRARLSAIDAFTLDARIAASGNFGVTGSLHWVQHGDTFNVHFAGPLGAGVVDLIGNPGFVLIRSGDQQYATTDPEHFLLKQFGWTLPLQGLRYWALGLPAPERTTPGTSSITLDDDGTLRTLRQGGWDIDYPQYQAVASHRLPRKITMQGSKTQLRIVADRWTLSAANPSTGSE